MVYFFDEVLLYFGTRYKYIKGKSNAYCVHLSFAQIHISIIHT